MNVKKILAFAVGPIVGALLGLVTLPIIAWGFSAEDVGRLNILKITVSFSLLLFVLGLDQAYIREFHEAPDKARLLKASFLPGCLLLVIAGTVGLIFRIEISQLLYEKRNPIFFWITLFSVIAAYISRFLSLILRMQERGIAFSMSQVIPKILLLIIVACIVLINLPRNFLTLQLAFFISSLAVVAVYFWNTRNQWRPALKTKINKEELHRLLDFGAPLIFSGLAYWGLVTTSSISLRAFSTFAELGIYSIATSIAGVAVIFQSIFTIVWAPIIYKWVANNDDLSKLDHVARQALAIVCVIFVGCGVFSWTADYLLPPQYSIVKYLVLCAIVQPLLYTLSEITCIGISITRRTTLNIWITGLALLMNIALNVWLVPLYGASGALIGNALAYFVFFIMRTEASAFVWRQIPRLRLYIFTGFAVVFSVATVAFGPILLFNFAWVWLVFLPLVGWFFKLEIIEIFLIGKNIILKRTIKI